MPIAGFSAVDVNPRGPRRSGVWGRIPEAQVSSATPQLNCPHCNQTLRAFELPDGSGWDGQIHLACFNDDCPYFERGWVRMKEQYAVNASYRYRVNPASGKDSPLGVWSKTAIRDRILDADVTVTVQTRDEPESSGGSEKESSS